jgi:uncharacterized membrane protein
MEKNIGKTDKIVRVILAVIFAAIGYAYSPWLYLVSAVLLVTVWTGFCLPYRLLGISTVEKKKKRR